MTAIFKADFFVEDPATGSSERRETTFHAHFHKTFKHAFLVKMQLPFGLHTRSGEVAISPEGRILGWRFALEKWETFCSSIESIPIALATETRDCYYYCLSGRTDTDVHTNMFWVIEGVTSFNGAESSEEVARFERFEDAIAWLSENFRDHIPWDGESVDVIQCKDAYQY